MADLYDKLGDLLNQALENGKIPNANDHTEQTDKKETNEDQNFCEDKKKSGLFYLKNKKIEKNSRQTLRKTELYTEKKREKINTEKAQHKYTRDTQKSAASIIKMYKYTQNIHFPPLILQSMNTLGVAYPFSADELKRQYHLTLKKHHPDAKNCKKTIQNTEDVFKNRQFSVDDIKQAYEILKKYFCIK